MSEATAFQQDFIAVPATEVDELFNERVRFANKVRRELTERMGVDASEGASVCKNCGVFPVCMIKTPSYTKDGVEYPILYEVGCVICPPFYVEREDGLPAALDGKETRVKRRSFSARAYSIEQAVNKWNTESFVEDTHRMEMNVPAEERARIQLIAE